MWVRVGGEGGGGVGWKFLVTEIIIFAKTSSWGLKIWGRRIIFFGGGGGGWDVWGAPVARGRKTIHFFL